MENNLKLPPVKELFQQAWETFKAGWRPLFFLNLLVIATYILLGLAALVSFLVLAILPYYSLSANFSPAVLLDNPVALLTGLFLFTVFGLLAVLVGSLMPVGSVLILDQPSSPPGLRDTLARSFRLLVPLSFSLLLGGVLAFGGFFVFILPAIIFQFFFLFTTYEVVLGGRKYGGALRRSFYLVLNHSRAILLRLILFWLLYFVVDVFIPNVLRQLEPRTGDILAFIISVLFSWYGMAFTLTLYKQVRAVSEPEKERRLFWLGVVSLLGWVIFVALSVWAVKEIASGAANQIITKILNDIGQF